MSIWPFPPQVAIREKLEWKTDVIRCKSAEQRIALRPYPRTEYEMDLQFVPSEAEAATRLNELYSIDDILLPLWNDRTYIGSISSGQTSLTLDTTYSRYLDGEKVFIIGDTGLFETVDITTVGASSLTLTSPYVSQDYSGAVVAPCYPFSIKDALRFRKSASDYLIASIGFIGTTNFEITGTHSYPSYNSTYVVTDRPLVAGGYDRDYRETKAFSNLAGPYSKSASFDYHTSSSTLRWSFDTVADAWAFRKWLYVIKGKQGSFYVPRWTRDFIPSRNLTTAGDSIYVYTNSWYDNGYLEHICVVDTDGNLEFHKVDSIAAVSATEEKLVLESAVGYDLNVENVEMICRLPLMRSNSDSIEFVYRSGGSVDVAMPIMETPA